MIFAWISAACSRCLLTNRWRDAWGIKCQAQTAARAPVSSTVRQHMKSHTLVAMLPLAVLAVALPAVAADAMCKPLREFIGSVKPRETHVLKFHTIWGGGFNGSDQDTMFEKSCEHNEYGPAKGLCAYLMESGAVEFAGENAKSVISCLSSKAHFASGMLHGISYSLTFGTEDRGSNVDVEYSKDEQLGGMVLSITARGY
jgi:hypothetical protein